MEKYVVTKHFRCTKEEDEMIREKAKNEKKAVSAYLRDAALDRNLPKIAPEIESILNKLQGNELKIGVNINQAVRLCNCRKMITGDDYQTLTHYLKLLMEQRKKVIQILQDLMEV